MKNWCKILQGETHDILVQRIYDEENGEHCAITVNVQVMQCTLRASFEEDAKAADKFFEEFDLEKGLGLASKVLKEMGIDEKIS